MSTIETFVPILPRNCAVSLEGYQELVRIWKENKSNLKSIENLICILQNNIFNRDTTWFPENYSKEKIYENKCNAAQIVLDIIQPLKDHKYLHMTYLSQAALNYLALGRCGMALKCYKEMLETPGVADVPYNRIHYKGELEFAAHLVHNICTLYMCAGKSLESAQTKQKYSYVFEAEKLMVDYQIRCSPALKNYCTKEYNILCDEKSNVIYYDCTFAGLGPYALNDSSKGGMLEAICEDCKNGHKTFIVGGYDNKIVIGLSDSRMLLMSETFQGEILLITPSIEFNKIKNSLSSDSNINDESPRNSTGYQKNSSLDSSITELNELIGLKSVKAEASTLINLQRLQKIRKERRLPELTVSRHLVFVGNPGTGKTSVARLLAKIYHELGVLSKGQLIEVDRSGLVGGYVGQTAIKTREVIQKALGGVLFIDEAYTLAKDNTPSDYGQEAIDTILKAMEDNRGDLVIIVAGYPHLMENFLNSNPGLKSRFSKYIIFEDYTPFELLEIFCNICSKAGFKLTEDAQAYILNYFTEKYEHRDETFANGREARNLFDHTVMNQANRLAMATDIQAVDISLLTLDDVKQN